MATAFGGKIVLQDGGDFDIEVDLPDTVENREALECVTDTLFKKVMFGHSSGYINIMPKMAMPLMTPGDEATAKKMEYKTVQWRVVLW